MRPPEFTGGNSLQRVAQVVELVIASMRPPEFTGGNITASGSGQVSRCGFNEAAGIHRRKLDACW